MSRIRFLLDENVDPVLRKALHQQIPEMTVWRVGDPIAPPNGTLDPAILDWCSQNRFILITNNRASMPIHLKEHLSAGRSAPGIFVLNPNITQEQILQELVLVWSASDLEEYANLIWYLPILG